MSLKNSSVKIRIPKLLKIKLNNKRVNRIYRKFEKNFDLKENFVVAVSGGPDSLALAFLAKIFSIKKKLKPKFIIIDHKLRPESSKEAKIVKRVLKKNLINAEILIWRGKKPFKNIQSNARKKRYELLTNICKNSNINHILLGHHQDDLIENFFIRLLRGSGLKGLISLDKKSINNNMNLWRPLLDQKKIDLIFLSKHVFNFYLEDPSNENVKFKRIIIRKLIDELHVNGLDKDKLLKTINNLKYSNEMVNFYVNKNLKNNSFLDENSNKIFLNKLFFFQSYEVIFRSLSESVRLIGKKYYSVRGKKIDKIISLVERGKKFRVTLGGCIIEKVNQTVIISKEC